MARAVLLGNSGFVGRAVERCLLRASLKVHGFSSTTLDLNQPAALHRLDSLLDGDATLIVLSGLTPEKGADVETLARHLGMLLNLGQHLQERTIGHCVYVSSDAVYPLRFSPITEETGVEPANLYALAKYAGERILSHACQVSGSSLLVLRLTATYGPGDTHHSYGPNRFMQMALAERRIQIFGNGEEQRDHIYIEDVAALILRLLERGATGTFNLATGASHSFREVAELVRDIVPDAEIASVLRQGEITHRHFDVTRLFLTVPDFIFTPLDLGLRAYYQACSK